MSSNFLVFHTSGGILLRPVDFQLLIFFSTTLSSSSITCPSLMSSWWLIIFVIGLSVILEEFPRKYLKCSSLFYSLSSRLAAFSLAFEVLFLLLPSFTVHHTNCDCLSPTFLISLIWPGMYSSCSFWYVLFLSGLS